MDDLELIGADCIELEGKDGDPGFGNLAFLSLRIALRSYFKTYQTAERQLHAYTNPISVQSDDGYPPDCFYSDGFIEASAEVVVHFQHFVELICKDILLKMHPLLPTIAPDNAVVFYKALKGVLNTTDENAKIKTVDFSVAVRRLCDLIRAGVIDSNVYGFLVVGNPLLLKLGSLRNQIWHRGARVLRYMALDEFTVRYLLPFTVKICSLTEYKRHSWKPRDLHCMVDPIDELLNAGQASKLDYPKIALLKELGRAAYENPLRASFHALLAENPGPKRGRDSILASFDRQHIRRAAHIAQHELGTDGAVNVKTCPVCSATSLLIYKDTEVQDFDPEQGTATVFDYVWQVKCTCCTFAVSYEVGNPKSDHGLPMDDYWEVVG